MVSGLKATTYEERLTELGLTSLEERRHQADMLQTFKIIHGLDKVKRETWFKMAGESERVTRSVADPLNLKLLPGRLDVRRNFFANRVISDWNNVPTNLKRSKNVTIFKNGYRKHRWDMVQHT